MGSIITKVRLQVPVSAYPPDYIVQQWAEGLKRKAELINQKRKTKIPDEKAYQTDLAGPAQLGFKDVINPAFKSRKGLDQERIKDAHATNVNRAFENWNSSLDFQFETVDDEAAKRFKELVDQAKDLYAKGAAERGLRMTGDRITGPSVAPITALWLTGDLLAKSLIRPGDELITGEPVDISLTGMRSTFKAALTQRIIQAGIVVIRSGFKASTIAAENASLCTVANALLNTALYESFVEPIDPLKSHLGFEVVNDTLYLVVQVYKK